VRKKSNCRHHFRGQKQAVDQDENEDEEDQDEEDDEGNDLAATLSLGSLLAPDFRSKVGSEDSTDQQKQQPPSSQDEKQ